MGMYFEATAAFAKYAQIIFSFQRMFSLKRYLHLLETYQMGSSSATSEVLRQRKWNPNCGADLEKRPSHPSSGPRKDAKIFPWKQMPDNTYDILLMLTFLLEHIIISCNILSLGPKVHLGENIKIVELDESDKIQNQTNPTKYKIQN